MYKTHTFSPVLGGRRRDIFCISDELSSEIAIRTCNNLFIQSRESSKKTIENNKITIFRKEKTNLRLFSTYGSSPKPLANSAMMPIAKTLKKKTRHLPPT